MKALLLTQPKKAISTTLKPLILTLELSVGILPLTGCNTGQTTITPAPAKSESQPATPSESESSNQPKPSDEISSVETGSPAAAPGTSRSQSNPSTETANPIVDRNAELESIARLLASGDVTSAEAKLKSLLVRELWL